MCLGMFRWGLDQLDPKGDGIQCRVRRSRGDWAGPLRFARLADATPCWPFGCSKMPDTSIFGPIFNVRIFYMDFYGIFNVRISPVRLRLSNERMKPRTLATTFGTLPFIWRPRINCQPQPSRIFCDQLPPHIPAPSSASFRELCSPRVPGNSSFGWGMEREILRERKGKGGKGYHGCSPRVFDLSKENRDKVDSMKQIASKSIYCFLAGFHSYIQCVGMYAWAIWLAERYMAVHEWR